MAEREQPSSLQISYHPPHERREWIVHRIGWVIMGLLCVAGLSGIFGDGPASRTTAGKVGSDLYIDYDRYVRHQAPFGIKVYCKPGSEKQFSLSFDRAFLRDSEILEIQPTPASTVILGDKCLFRFDSANDQEHLVVFRFESETFGKVETEISLNAKSSHQIQQFIWP